MKRILYFKIYLLGDLVMDERDAVVFLKTLAAVACRLEDLLAEKLALVHQMPSGRAGWGQLQLSVDAHRQVGH